MTTLSSWSEDYENAWFVMYYDYEYPEGLRLRPNSSWRYFF